MASALHPEVWLPPPLSAEPRPSIPLRRSSRSTGSLCSGPRSPATELTSSLPRRSSSSSKPPLRALYDLLIGPMEGVSGALSGLGGGLAGKEPSVLLTDPAAQKLLWRRQPVVSCRLEGGFPADGAVLVASWLRF